VVINKKNKNEHKFKKNENSKNHQNKDDSVNRSTNQTKTRYHFMWASICGGNKRGKCQVVLDEKPKIRENANTKNDMKNK